MAKIIYLNPDDARQHEPNETQAAIVEMYAESRGRVLIDANVPAEMGARFLRMVQRHNRKVGHYE